MKCPHCRTRLIRQFDVLWCPVCGHEEPAEGDVLPDVPVPMSTRWPPHINPRGEYHSTREKEDHDA